MALSLVERWQQTADVEVFYDLSSRKLLYKKYNWIYSQSVDTRQSSRYADLQTLKYSSHSSKFLGAALSPDDLFLAFHRTPNELEIVALTSLEMGIVRLGKQRVILGYHWCSPSFLSDFLLITTAGVDFLKLQDHPVKLLTVKTYSFSTSQYWFEPVSGTLVLCHSSKKPGVMRAYHCYQSKVPKFDGQKFKLLQSVPATNVWAGQAPGCLNLTSLSQSEDAHKCVLAKMYDTVYFLHFTNGLLHIYSIAPDSVSLLPQFITRACEPFDLYVLDNLIVLQSHRLKEEYIYDIKAVNFNTAPFAVVNYELWADTDAETDDQPRKRKSSQDKPAPAPTGLIRVDQDVLIDAKEGRCYRVSLKPTELISDRDSLTKVLLFLLRRSGCKMAAFAYLKERLRTRLPLKGVSEFFMTTSKVYRQVALEKQGGGGLKRQLTEMVDTARMSLAVEPELRAEWVTVMLQSETQALVLQDLCNDPALPPHYTTSVLLEYQRSLVAQELHVNLNIQLLIVAHLVHTRNYVLLQTMLQFRALMDSREIALQLVALGGGGGEDGYRPAMQLGIDMLARLKEYGELAKVLVSQGMVFELISTIDTEALTPETQHVVDTILRSLSDPEHLSLVRSYLGRRKLSL